MNTQTAPTLSTHSLTQSCPSQNNRYDHLWQTIEQGIEENVYILLAKDSHSANLANDPSMPSSVSSRDILDQAAKKIRALESAARVLGRSEKARFDRAHAEIACVEKTCLDASSPSKGCTAETHAQEARAELDSTNNADTENTTIEQSNDETQPNPMESNSSTSAVPAINQNVPNTKNPRIGEGIHQKKSLSQLPVVANYRTIDDLLPDHLKPNLLPSFIKPKAITPEPMVPFSGRRKNAKHKSQIHNQLSTIKNPQSSIQNLSRPLPLQLHFQ